MTTHPTPDLLPPAAPEQPATMADVMRRIAAALEILPQPITVQIDNLGGHYIQLSGPGEFESWRQWLGAPDTEPGRWAPYEPPYETSPTVFRRWRTTRRWRGHDITIVRVEFAPAQQVTT